MLLGNFVNVFECSGGFHEVEVCVFVKRNFARFANTTPARRKRDAMATYTLHAPDGEGTAIFT